MAGTVVDKISFYESFEVLTVFIQIIAVVTSYYEFDFFSQMAQLIEWRIYASAKWVIIGSDNGLWPGRHQDIIWTNAKIFLIRRLGTTFS